MKTFNTDDYIAIVKIIPFSERRTCFCDFAKQNEIKIEKINWKNYINKEDLKKFMQFIKTNHMKEISFMKKSLLLKLLKMLRNF